ncbi:MAG TPA: glycosyltransferase family 4 protein [Bacteroidales bacterium]|nr:glycosyltransferase family 4 protein [Bacteroidales bacterium]
MIIHLHFHSRTTGITKSIENIIPLLNKFSIAMVFGYGIKARKIKLLPLLRLVFKGDNLVIHAHRNNEIIFALFLRFFGGKFKLVFTRHAESKPSGFTNYLMGKADHLVSLNSEMSKKLPFQNTVVKHGVNTTVFQILGGEKLTNIPQENLISVIGRIRPAKGQLVVLKALVPLLRNNLNWGLVMIGKIDKKKYAGEILSVASENKISSQVHIMPESNEIVNYYHASKVVVIASRSEGFSLVCLESMACGLITVATDNVGIHSEVITHGADGFLFPKNDSDSLRDILSKVIENKIYLNPTVVRQSILDNWSIDKSVFELLKVYQISTIP